jgi:hypothetical protein
MTTYSNQEIAKKVSKAKASGWQLLDLSQCKVQDHDLLELLSEPEVWRA